MTDLILSKELPDYTNQTPDMESNQQVPQESQDKKSDLNQILWDSDTILLHSDFDEHSLYYLNYS